MKCGQTEQREGQFNLELECGPKPDVMADQPNIGGALCKSSVIPFRVPCRKVWLTPAAQVPCSNAANIGERKTLTQSEFCTWQNSVRGQEPPKMYIYTVSQKSSHLLIVCNFVKSQPTFKFFALLESVWNLLQTPYPYDITHLTLGTLLHHVGKLKMKFSADVEENANKLHFNRL